MSAVSLVGGIGIHDGFRIEIARRLLKRRLECRKPVIIREGHEKNYCLQFLVCLVKSELLGTGVLETAHSITNTTNEG
jgi:hypothetical protein